MFLCLLGIMRVVIWTTRKKELYDDESFSSQTLVAFYKHQIRVKIRPEGKRLSLLEFGKRWVTVARLCQLYLQLRHCMDLPILSYQKCVTTQPR